MPLCKPSANLKKGKIIDSDGFTVIPYKVKHVPRPKCDNLKSSLPSSWDGKPFERSKIEAIQEELKASDYFLGVKEKLNSVLSKQFTSEQAVSGLGGRSGDSNDVLSQQFTSEKALNDLCGNNGDSNDVLSKQFTSEKAVNDLCGNNGDSNEVLSKQFISEKAVNDLCRNSCDLNDILSEQFTSKTTVSDLCERSGDSNDECSKQLTSKTTVSDKCGDYNELNDRKNKFSSEKTVNNLCGTNSDLNDVLSKQFISEKTVRDFCSDVSFDKFNGFEIVCYGLGSFFLSATSRYQLALLLLLKDYLKPDAVRIFDPMFFQEEINLLKEFGLDVLDINERCKRSVTCKTLFYMPHCQLELFNNLLSANWNEKCLSNIIIFGNSFQHFFDHMPDKDFENTARYVFHSSDIVTEVKVLNTFRFYEVFSDLTVIHFPFNDLSKFQKWDISKVSVNNEEIDPGEN